MQAEFESDKENLDATLASKQDELGSLDEQCRRQPRKRPKSRDVRKKRSRRTIITIAATTIIATRSRAAAEAAEAILPMKDRKYRCSQKIVQAAYSRRRAICMGRDKPYVGLDCSGLVQYCHAVAGISLPHYSESQYAGGRKVSSPEPGDICWKPGHVGIYIGGGMMIEAQQTGTNIMISPVRAQGYARYW